MGSVKSQIRNNLGGIGESRGAADIICADRVLKPAAFCALLSMPATPMQAGPPEALAESLEGSSFRTIGPYR